MSWKNLKKIVQLHDINYSIGVGNATDAMQLLLKADNIGSNDEIIFVLTQ